MRKTFIITMLCSALGTLTAQNEVSNIRVALQDTMVIVTYDLAAKADVEAFVSFDDGVTYTGPLKQVSGAIGKGILPEKNKIFVWDASKEIGYVDFENAMMKVVSVKEEEPEIKPEVKPEPKPEPPPVVNAPKVKPTVRFPKKTFLTANVLTVELHPMSYGFTVGHFKRLGWYLSATSNFNFSALGINAVATTEETNGRLDNGLLPFYSGKTSAFTYSAMAGIMFKILPFWAIYAGAGVSAQSLFWETVNGDWIEYNAPIRGYGNLSNTDLIYEGGFLLDIKGFTLSAAVVNYLAGYFGLKVGIGFAF